MKKNLKIEVNGEAFPCRTTMGAMLRFKRETGKEVTEISCTSDLIVFLWCCVASASNADGKAFELSLEDFADSVSSETMEGWAAELMDMSGAADDEKKSR